MMTLADRIASLPEIYQPLYGHPELGGSPSRGCDDRLVYIGALHDAMHAELGRAVRVLDLGCAQGYISLSLAARGASVVGVDYLEANVEVCRTLASEHPEWEISFRHGQIEGLIEDLEQGQFDLVLGLSVFHHICHQLGAEATTSLLGRLAERVAVGVFELALAGEPLYWAPSLPSDERALLSGFSFLHELARFPTHLSELSRPLYVASSRFWYLSGTLHPFEHATAESHALARGVHQASRKYFFGGNMFAKVVRFDGALGAANRDELQHEFALLDNPPEPLRGLWPRMEAAHIGEREGWIVREKIQGELLLDIIRHGGSYDERRVIDDVLEQLVTLEAQGLYHNDVRIWNALLTDQGYTVLIDFGAISAEAIDCVWPDDIFLAFFLFVHDVLERTIGPLVPARPPFISPYNLPEPYASWLAQLWSLPRQEWSFRYLQETLRAPGASGAPGMRNGDMLWIGASERHMAAFGGHLTQQDRVLNDNRVRIDGLQATVESLEAQRNASNELSAGLAGLEQRYAELSRRIEGARETAAGDVQAMAERAQNSERALVSLVGRVGELETRYQAVAQEADEARRQWAEMVEHQQGILAQLAPLVGRLDSADQHAMLTVEELQKLRVVSTHAAMETLDLRQSLNKAVSDLDRTRQQLMASEIARQGMQQQIELIYSSRSFRWTRPFRYLSSRMRPRLSTLSGILRPGWHRLVRRPWGRRLGLALFYPFPRLRARVHASIAAHTRTQTAAPSTVSEPVLSPAAADIHQRLQRLIDGKPRKGA